MDFRRIFKKDYTIGLDIGSSSIKVAQFITKEDGLHLVKADLKELKRSQDGPLREQEIVSALKDLLHGAGLKKSKIIATINCPQTAIKVVKEPYMPKAELRGGINLKAKSYFPFPVDDSYLDYEILGDVVEKGARKYEVAVAVSPKATVDKYLALLGKAGIKPASFIPRSYAAQKLVGHLYDAKKNVTAFLTVGKAHTELIVFKSRSLVFSRKIPVTGEDFTKAMTGTLVSDRGRTELDLAEAEKIKKEVGIPSEGETKIIDGKISTTQIMAMLRAPLEQLLGEIGRCFDYYREESGGGKIDSLTLFGGGAALTGLVKYLSDELGIEVALGDAFEGLKIESNAVLERDKISYRLGLAVGAALTGAKGINLLPPEIKEETKRAVKRGTIEAVATAIIFLSALSYIGMKIQLGNFEKRISVAKKELSSLQPQLEQAESRRLANRVLENEPHWDDIFKALAKLIPRNVYLTNISMRNDAITIKGIVVSEDAERILSNFILTLEKGIFNDVRLVSSKDLKDRAGDEFEIRCWADEKAVSRKL